MSITGAIKARIQGWKKIDEIPYWLNESHIKWSHKLRTHPYNRTKHFVGKTFVYRVRHGMGRQGEAPVLGIYKKLRKIKKEG